MQVKFNYFIQLCDSRRIPLAPKKIEGPSTSLYFLGIQLDTAHMEIKLPEEKLSRIQQTPSLGTGV